MYRFVSLETGIAIVDEQQGSTLLADIGVVVRLDGGERVLLGPVSGGGEQDAGDGKVAEAEIIHHVDASARFQHAGLAAADESPYSITFADAEYGICCTLGIENRQRSCRLVAALELRQKPFHRNRSLAPEYGIELHSAALNGTQRWMANYRFKDWWTRPAFGSRFAAIPRRTESLLMKQGTFHAAIVPVSDAGSTAEIAGRDNSEEGDADLYPGAWVLAVSSLAGGISSCRAAVVALSVADSPQAAMQALYRESDCLTLEQREARAPAPFAGELGWCTWDAMYHDVSEQGILAKMEELREKGIALRWIIIDDGWLQTKEMKLLSLQEDCTKFPSGFAWLTRKLKSEYGIRWVGVWHSFAGYWGGIHPDSPVASELRDSLYLTGSGTLIPHPDPAKGFAFWNSWYAYLEQQGVDFVKVDGQSALSNHLLFREPIGTAARGAHAGLEAAAGLHFGHAVINCMGMATENIWNRPVTSLMRFSDDFVPEDPDGFPELAMQNCYNAHFLGAMYRGDADMFWTGHAESRRHALLRAIFGGPVYISDAVGATVPGDLSPLVFSSGRIAGCDGVAVPTDDILYHDPREEPVLLKVWNRCRSAVLVAAFNIHRSGAELASTVGFPENEQAEPRNGYLYDVQRGVSVAMRSTAAYEIRLRQGEGAIYQLMVAEPFVTPIGLLDTYVPRAGIAWETTESPVSAASGMTGEGGSASRYLCTLHDAGTFGFFVQSRPFEVRVQGRYATPSPLSGVPEAYKVEVPAGALVEIIERT